jgi:hypothetical protein
MRDMHLILLDGLPGSGKSTATDYVAHCLNEAGVAARAYYESEDGHPLNVGGPLHPAGVTTGEALFRQYTVERYIAESLARWRTLAAETARNGVVPVLDSYPYQNAARILLQMDADPARIAAYITEVEAIAAPLSPGLIFLEAADPVAAWEWAVSVRGSEWAESTGAIVTECPYVWNRGLGTIDGMVAMMGAYAALLRDLLATTTLDHIVLPHTGGDWDVRDERIRAYLAG